MIKETAVVMRIESDSLWVAGVQGSTCGACSARAGCGQRLLAAITARAPMVRVLLDGRDSAHYQVGDEVEIAIPEDVVVKGSLFIYFCPLLGLLLAAGLAESLFNREALTVAAGFVGFMGGGLLVRAVSVMAGNKRHLQPSIVTTISVMRAV